MGSIMPQEQSDAAKQQVWEKAEHEVAEIDRKADSRAKLLFEQVIEQLEPKKSSSEPVTWPAPWRCSFRFAHSEPAPRTFCRTLAA
jgi:hypothetical protein